MQYAAQLFQIADEFFLQRKRLQWHSPFVAGEQAVWGELIPDGLGLVGGLH